MTQHIRITTAIAPFICASMVVAHEADQPEHQIFELGDFQLEGGTVLPDAKLSYTTHGTLNDDKSNAILVPSFFSGDHHGQDFLIGPGMALDTDKYFVITTDMFANGLSSSPSNTPAPFDGGNFPAISTRDNVAATHQLVTEGLGIDHLVAVTGFSMGAQQTFQWGVSHPEFMDALMPYCGHAQEYDHGKARLAGAISAVQTDAAWNGGAYEDQPEAGLKSLARHWAAWGFSPAWWREGTHQSFFGHETVEDHIVQFWEGYFLARDANNLLSHMQTWITSGVGNTPGFDGDHVKALESIEAQVLYMPCETDLYFTLEDAQLESEHIPNVTFTPIPTVWGHMGGLGVNPEDNKFIADQIGAFLQGL